MHDDMAETNQGQVEETVTEITECKQSARTHAIP